jgi:hypothetical protein
LVDVIAKHFQGKFLILGTRGVEAHWAEVELVQTFFDIMFVLRLADSCRASLNPTWSSPRRMI